MSQVIEIDLGHRIIEAELADDPVSKARGMRFRSEGKMLFSFYERKPVIDMMFVPVPLQLVFLDSEKKVVDIQEAKPWRFYRPGEPARYLLESTEPLELEEGDRLEFEI